MRAGEHDDRRGRDERGPVEAGRAPAGEAANDAFDGAIRPAHTLYDGDAVFTLATKQVNATYVDVAALVEEAVATAVRRAVRG